MSHVFISYSRADKPYLEKLVVWLKDHNFAVGDLWYDQHIESGNNWPEEIATALDEAYAVVVIVSAASVKSQYCTYEWAYAMGQGIPIVPLVFENVNFTDVPAPLASKQFVPCIEQIPVTLIDELVRFKTVPPYVEAINSSIYNIIHDIHRVYFMLDWIENELRAFGDDTPNQIMENFVANSAVAQRKLETLMMEKALILTTKQHRLCWKLIDLLKILAQMVGPYDEFFDNIPLLKMDAEWLSTIEYFNEFKYWNGRMRFYFQQNLENHKELLVEIARIFPMFEAYQITTLLKNCDVRRKERIMAQIKSES